MGAVTTKVGTTQTKNIKSSNRRFNVNYDTSTSGISASINYSGKKYRASYTRSATSSEITIGIKGNNDSENSISFDASIPELGVGATFSNTSNTNDGSTTTFVRYGITILIVPVVVFVSSNATIAEA